MARKKECVAYALIASPNWLKESAYIGKLDLHFKFE